MTSPSEEFKRKLLAPIEDLFQEALDGSGGPQAAPTGGRNWQLPRADGFAGVLPDTPPGRGEKNKQKLGTVDEAAFDEAMHAVNGLVGLPSAKRSIRRLADFARIEAERRRLKLPKSQIGFNCVFTGAPGTGKTTVARLIGKIMKALGLLERGHTVEVDKSGLVGGYLGETPLKVRKAFDRADGGVLFIDEAYSLTHDTDDLYGQEAVDGIVKQMEDHRGRVIVIVAGYPQEMRKFIASNPGLRSRFNRTIFFDDFDAEELLAIQKQMLRSTGFDSSDGFLLRSEMLWQAMYRDRLTFDGNARLVRSALEIALENQAGRLVRSERKERHELCELMPADLDGVEAQLMARSNESIATVSADARYFLKRLGTPDTKEESFFLKTFSGDLALTNRVSRNSVRLRRPCLTALLLTQKDAYQGFIRKVRQNRSGLLPRFLHLDIDHRGHKPVRIDRRRRTRIRAEYAERMRELIEAFRFECDPGVVAASKGAAAHLKGIEDECRELASGDESITGEVLRRRAEQMWRVSLCLHLVRHGNASLLHPLSLAETQTALKVVESSTLASG